MGKRKKERGIMKYTGNERKYVEQVLNSDNKSATSGTFTERLEKAFAKKFNAKYAIAHNSGTSALHTSLLALGIKAGDEVISPGLTVMMDTFATLYCGAKPVYADIDPQTFTIDREDIIRKITDRTKAIIAVNLYGLPCDMEPIMEIANDYGLPVVEDSAQCFLGKYMGRTAGSLTDLGIFSFENSKHISAGEGGMVVTDNEELAERVRKFGGIGFRNLTAESGRVRANEEVFQNPNYKRHDTLGYNYRMPEINAALVLGQLERLDVLVEKRQTIAKYYRDALGECTWLIPQTTPEGYTNSYWTYALNYTGVFGKSWQDIRKAYIRNGGDGFYGAWLVPYQEPVMANYNYSGRCPVAEKTQPNIMQFKTNYHDKITAQDKALALAEMIQSIERGE